MSRHNVGSIQHNLFDYQKSMEARDRGIGDVTGGTNIEWREEALSAGFRAAEELSEITSDDVAERMSRGVATRDNRAMGPIMLHLAKEKIIKPTDVWRATRRISSHGSPRRVWKSLTYVDPAETRARMLYQ
jgi:hypothetical protein